MIYYTHPIVQQLRAQRLSRGFTVFDFSGQLGYSQKAIYRVERGIYGGRFKFICDYADALGYELQLCEKSSHTKSQT